MSCDLIHLILAASTGKMLNIRRVRPSPTKYPRVQKCAQLLHYSLQCGGWGIKCEDLIKENIKSMKSAFRIKCELSSRLLSHISRISAAGEMKRKAFSKLIPVVSVACVGESRKSNTMSEVICTRQDDH